jgi:hypothetical protein
MGTRASLWPATKPTSIRAPRCHSKFVANAHNIAPTSIIAVATRSTMRRPTAMAIGIPIKLPMPLVIIRRVIKIKRIKRNFTHIVSVG